jgi:hypothetical protein
MKRKQKKPIIEFLQLESYEILIIVPGYIRLWRQKSI